MAPFTQDIFHVQLVQQTEALHFHACSVCEHCSAVNHSYLSRRALHMLLLTVVYFILYIAFLHKVCAV